MPILFELDLDETDSMNKKQQRSEKKKTHMNLVQAGTYGRDFRDRFERSLKGKRSGSNGTRVTALLGLHLTSFDLERE